ncbi:hypothetical protein J7M00_02340, partial [bacterium]|nr:hypothetical protein [bacterium]
MLFRDHEVSRSEFFNKWRDEMYKLYGKIPSEDIFIIHTYLVWLARVARQDPSLNGNEEITNRGSDMFSWIWIDPSVGSKIVEILRTTFKETVQSKPKVDIFKAIYEDLIGKFWRIR